VEQQQWHGHTFHRCVGSRSNGSTPQRRNLARSNGRDSA
jgi:hypothetical protein